MLEDREKEVKFKECHLHVYLCLHESVRIVDIHMHTRCFAFININIGIL